jgi:hypothetical protein
VTATITKAVNQLRDREGITDSELRELNALHRLPKISEATARKLLGPLADAIPTPTALPKMASPCPSGYHAASKAEIKAAKKAIREGATSTTAATTEAIAAPDDSTAPPEPTTTTVPPERILSGCAPD